DFASLVLEAKHQDAVLGRQTRDARDERRIAVELDPGRVDRALGVRRGDHRLELARERAAERGFRAVERRAPMRRGDFSDLQFTGSQYFSFYELDTFQRNSRGPRVE